jgi:D-alanyl-D-alanine carboxypeptidase
LWVCAAAAAAAPAIDPKAVNQVVSEWLASTGAPSASIAIVQEGRLAYAQAYGAARLQPRVAATHVTRYAIDSVSKEFTAAAVLLLAEQGKLKLDDPIARWFPQLQEAGAITLRQLLTHTSGIRDYWPQDFLTPEMTHPTTTAAIIDEWVRRPLDYEPGTDWQYSNTGYVLAGAVVENASGERLFEFLGHEVFAPLHMRHVAENTGAADGAAHPAGSAAGYTRHGLGPVIAAPREGSGWLFGAAGLEMQADELALWDMSLIGRTLLKADSYQAEFAPMVLKSGRATEYALGLDVESIGGRMRIGHAGGGSGFLADNRIWPEERTAVVVLTNNDWADPADLNERIAFMVLTPAPEEARARELFDALQHGRPVAPLLSPIGNFYFTPRVLADLHSSLAPLGPMRLIELEHQSQRGGMTTRRWKILCSAARLEAVERSRPDGSIEQFMVVKKED